MGKLFRLLIASAALALPTSANAEDLLFTLTGDQTASFVLNSTPFPNVVFSDEFRIENVTGTVNSSSQTFDVYFFSYNAYGGFALVSPIFADILTEGPALFTGTTASPTFLTGTFSLTGYDTTQGNFSLTIAPITSAVPEVSTWVMMLFGFGAIGFLLRRKSETLQTTA